MTAWVSVVELEFDDAYRLKVDARSSRRIVDSGRLRKLLGRMGDLGDFDDCASAVLHLLETHA